MANFNGKQTTTVSGIVLIKFLYYNHYLGNGLTEGKDRACLFTHSQTYNNGFVMKQLDKLNEYPKNFFQKFEKHGHYSLIKTLIFKSMGNIFGLCIH